MKDEIGKMTDVLDPLGEKTAAEASKLRNEMIKAQNLDYFTDINTKVMDIIMAK